MPHPTVDIETLKQFKDSIPYGLDMNLEGILPSYTIDTIYWATGEMASMQRHEFGGPGEPRVMMVEVDCTINRKIDSGYETWIGSSEFLKYINFYFAVGPRPQAYRVDVTGGISLDMINALYYPDTRVYGLNLFNDNAGDTLLNWDTPWLLNDYPELFNRYGFLGAHFINAVDVFRGMRTSLGIPGDPATRNSISLDPDAVGIGAFKPAYRPSAEDLEAIDDLNSIGAFDLGTAVARGRIASRIANQNLGQKTSFNISFRVEIPATFGELGGSTDLALYSFCQLDIRSISEDYNLGNFIANLSTFGGPFKFEPMAKFDQKTGTFYAPRTRRIYQDDQGNPYSGYVHYHGQSNPGPNGYIGFMSGPESGHMPDRKRLTTREVPNNKIVNLCQPLALDYRGLPFSHRDADGAVAVRLNGFPDPLRVSIDNSASPYGNLSFSNNLLTALRSKIGFADLIKATPESGRVFKTSLEKYGNMIFKKLALRSQRRPSELKLFANAQDDTLTDFDPNDFHYKVIAILNIEDIVAANSRFGHLIDFHRDYVKTLEDPDFWEDQSSAAFISQDFISGALSLCRIRRVELHRHRIQNHPSFNNRASTPAYGVYNDSDVGKIAFFENMMGPDIRRVSLVSKTRVHAQNLLKGILNIRQYPGRAVVGETTNRQRIDFKLETGTFVDGIEGVTLPMSITDKHLFFEATSGKYKYKLSLDLEDGLERSLKSKLSQLETALQRYTKYVSEYERYIIAISDESAGESEHTRAKKIYLDIFRDTPENPDTINRGVLMHIVSMYAFITYLLTRDDTFLNSDEGSVHQELIRSLTYSAGSWANVRFFLDNCNTLAYVFRQFVYGNKPDIENTLNLGLHKRTASFNNNKELPNNVMKISGDLPNIVKVHTPGTLFIDFSAPAEIDYGQGPVSSNNPILNDRYQMFYIQRISDGDPLDVETARVVSDDEGNFSVRRNAVPRRVNVESRDAVGEDDGFGRIVPIDPRDDANPLRVDVENALDRIGGMSWNSLVSKAGSLNPDLQSGCGEILTDPNSISGDVSDAILDAILSDGSLDIVRDTVKEDNDNNVTLREEDLELLRDTVRRVIEISDALDDSPAATVDADSGYRIVTPTGENEYSVSTTVTSEEINDDGDITADVGDAELEATLRELYGSGRLHAEGEAAAEGDNSERTGIYVVGATANTYARNIVLVGTIDDSALATSVSVVYDTTADGTGETSGDAQAATGRNAGLGGSIRFTPRGPGGGGGTSDGY